MDRDHIRITPKELTLYVAYCLALTRYVREIVRTNLRNGPLRQCAHLIGITRLYTFVGCNSDTQSGKLRNFDHSQMYLFFIRNKDTGF